MPTLEDTIKTIKENLPLLKPITSEAVVRANGNNFTVSNLPSLSPHLSLQRATIRQMLSLFLKTIELGDEASFTTEITQVSKLLKDVGATDEDVADYSKHCLNEIDEKTSEYLYPAKMKKHIDDFLQTDGADTLLSVVTTLYQSDDDDDMKEFMCRYTMNPLIKSVKRRPRLTFDRVSSATGALLDSLHQGLEHIAHKMMARDDFTDKQHALFNRLKSRASVALKKITELRFKFKSEILPKARELGERKLTDEFDSKPPKDKHYKPKDFKGKRMFASS